MNIVIISNFLNHHMIPVCNAFLKMDDVSFSFISMEKTPADRLNMGYKDYNTECDYVIRGYEGEEHRKKAQLICEKSDIVFLCSNEAVSVFSDFINQDAVIFKMSEHFNKNSFFNPVMELLRSIKYHKLYKKISKRPNTFLLCLSSYAKADYNKAGLFKNKCISWGYFPAIEKRQTKQVAISSMMWCGRMVDWKRPAQCLYLADHLKRQGMEFCIDMYGDGPEKEKLEKAIVKLHLEKQVILHPFLSSLDVQRIMAEHGTYLFTSNKKEGWGAVLNEAMGQGLLVFASALAGSTGFLASKDSCVVYKTKKELVKKAVSLIGGKGDAEIRASAASRIENTWNAEKAVSNLMKQYQLIKDGGRPISFNGEPGSIIE